MSTQLSRALAAVKAGHDGPDDEGDCPSCPERWPCSAERLRVLTETIADMARSVCIDWGNNWPVDESLAANLLGLLGEKQP